MLFHSRQKLHIGVNRFFFTIFIFIFNFFYFYGLTVSLYGIHKKYQRNTDMQN